MKSERTKMNSNWMLVLAVMMIATQLVGCGWYLRPSKSGPATAGPGYGAGAGDRWGGGAGPGEGMDGFGPGAPGDRYGEGVDGGKTRLSGEPKYMLDTVYFDFDESNIKPSEQLTMEQNLAWIRQNPGAQIRIEGHCDERGTEEYNLALGDRRADSVRNWLIERGVDPSRIDTVSKGEYEPAVPGSGEAAWSKNRRAEFLILE